MALIGAALQNFSMAKDGKAKVPITRGPYRQAPEDLEKLGTLGIKLRQWRVYRAMTIEILAEKARVSTGTISGIEGGRSGFTHTTISKLSKALHTTPGALLGLNPLAHAEFWSIWDRADERQRERIQDHAFGVVGKIKP